MPRPFTRPLSRTRHPFYSVIFFPFFFFPKEKTDEGGIPRGQGSSVGPWRKTLGRSPFPARWRWRWIHPSFPAGADSRAGPPPDGARRGPRPPGLVRLGKFPMWPHGRDAFFFPLHPWSGPLERWKGKKECGLRERRLGDGAGTCGDGTPSWRCLVELLFPYRVSPRGLRRIFAAVVWSFTAPALLGLMGRVRWICGERGFYLGFRKLVLTFRCAGLEWQSCQRLGDGPQFLYR